MGKSGYLVLCIIFSLCYSLSAQEVIIDDDSEDIIIVDDDSVEGSIIIAEENEEVFITIDEETPEEDIQTIVIEGEAVQAEAGDSNTLTMSVITGEEVTSGGARTMADALDSSAGIQITRYGGMSEPAYLSIRGSSPEQVLILLDGKRLNSAQGGGVNLNSLNPEIIERIEIIRGGGSSLYGENALGGVVNVITKEAEQDGLSGSVKTAAASDRSLEGSGDVSVKTEKTGVYFAFSALGSQGLYTYEDEHSGEEQRSNAGALGGGVSGKWTHNLSDTLRYTLSATADYSDKGVPGMLEFPSEEASMKDTGASFTAAAEWAGDAVSLETSHNFRYHERQYQDPGFYTGPVDETHKNSSWEGDVTLNFRQKGSASVQGRYDSLWSTALQLSSSLDEAEGELYRWQYTGLIHDSFIYGGMTLTPSLRYDGNYLRYDDAGLTETSSALSYNLGLNYHLPVLAGADFKMNAGRAYRTPSFDDLFWPETAFAAGNPDLKSETAWVADAGVSVKPVSWLSLEAVAFYHIVEDLILWRPQASGQWSPDNIDDALIMGLETELRMIQDVPALNGFAEFTGNLTRLDARNATEGSVNDNKVLTGKAPWTANGILQYQSYEGHFIRWETRYSDIRYTTDANTKYLDAYSVSDLSAAWVFAGGSRLQATVFNILGTHYVNSEYYPVSGREFRVEYVLRY